jgi:3-hydroxyisobutyrate dehydrogenase/glyoxylate/succinic semialdehyde reductase
MSQTPSTVAVLGLGIIGSRVAARLRDVGHHVRTWNRTTQPNSCASASEAVRAADIVEVFLKDGQAVREVFASIDVEDGHHPLVANHSTMDLESVAWLENWCAARGCEFLDAPFTGSKSAAEQGALVYYIGGSAEALERARPVLAVSSRLLMHIGAVGSASVVKIATNMISACTVQVLAEALAITTVHGVKAHQLLDAVRENACRSVLAEMKLPAMIAGDDTAHFSLSNMLKDSRLALALGSGLTTPLPATAAVCARMAELEQQGLGQRDFSALAQAYAQ